MKILNTIIFTLKKNQNKSKTNKFKSVSNIKNIYKFIKDNELKKISNVSKYINMQCNDEAYTRLNKIQLRLIKNENYLLYLDKISFINKINSYRKTNNKLYKFLVDSFLNKSYLTQIDLSQNYIYTTEIKFINKSVSENTNLKSLSLHGNRITCESADYLASILTNNKSIKHLSLSFCGLSNHAGIKIAQSLRNNNTLETLNLSGNKFNLKTLHEIADSLLLNKKFKKFILEHNTYDAMEVEKKSSKKSYILFMRKLLKINNK